MSNLTFRTLQAGEIECRPSHVKDGKANILLYISSRAAGRILNETVGNLNWKMDYKSVGNQIYGELSIWDESKNQWISKSDTGSESNIEAEKGQASDILKRCLVRFGVDELYSAPKISIDEKQQYGLEVSEIHYDEKRNITHLVLSRYGTEVYRWEKGQAPVQCTVQTKTAEEKAAELKAFCTSVKDTEDKKELKRFFEYYIRKMPEWNGPFVPKTKWEAWKERAKQSA